MVPSISYSFFTVMLMMLGLALNYKKLTKNKLLAAPQFKWIYLILLLFIITSFYAVLPGFHDFALSNFVKLVIIMSIAYKLIDTDRDLNYALWSYVFGSWYISFVAFQVGRNSGDRVEGIGTVDSPDANGIAAAVAPSLVLAFYYYWVSKNKFVKGIMVVAGVFIANAIVLINSRGAFLGVAVSMLYFVYHMFFSSFQRPHQKMTVIFLVIFGLSGVAVLADDSFVNRIKSITTDEVSEDKESGATRTVFWVAAWDLAKDHPWGVGVAGFQYYAPVYVPQNVNTGNSRNRAVHSTWFEALSELGYIGLFALIAMVVSSFRATAKARSKLRDMGKIDEYFKVRAIEAALVGFIITMSFLNRMRADVFYWCILYSACAYNIYVLKSQVDEDEKPSQHAK